MVDTITTQTGFAMDSKLTTSFYNQLAAVPSLHVGFAVAVGIAVARRCATRSRSSSRCCGARRSASPSSPPATTSCSTSPPGWWRARSATSPAARRPRAARARPPRPAAHGAAPGVRRGLSAAGGRAARRWAALLAVVLDGVRVADLAPRPGRSRRCGARAAGGAGPSSGRARPRPARAGRGRRRGRPRRRRRPARGAGAVLLVDEGLDAVQDRLVGHAPTVHEKVRPDPGRLRGGGVTAGDPGRGRGG